MSITRREFLASASVVVLAGVTMMNSIDFAFAQKAPTVEELMKPGELPDLVVGKPDAPVTIIEYASMTCPHCANFHATVFPKLKEKYIDTGKVRFIFREFPLDDLAAAASMITRCAGGDKTLALVEVLFQQQEQWAVRQPLPPLTAIAAEKAGMSQQAFDQCLSNQKMFDDLAAARTRANKEFGVGSTPSFFINGKPFTFQRTMNFEDIDAEIQPYLKS